LNKPAKFQKDRFTSFCVILVTDLRNAILRKTRLKFQLQFTRKKQFFLTYIKLSIPGPYNKSSAEVANSKNGIRPFSQDNEYKPEREPNAAGGSR